MSDASAGTAPAGRTDWGHVAMLVAIALFCACYLFDSARASPDVENLLLIAPAALLGCALSLVIIAGELRRGRNAAIAAAATPPGQAAGAARTLGFMALMALYVAGLSWGPFDLATFLFAAASLRLLGERRWAFLIGFSLAFTLAVMAFLAALMPSRLPMLLPL